MPRKLSLTKEQEMQVARRYEDGESTVQLSKSIGCAAATIIRILRDCGTNVRSISEASALRCSKIMQNGRYDSLHLVYQSMKNMKWIPAGSSYEYLRMQQLEVDDDVLLFDRCFDRIKYEFGGKAHHYTPDFTVILKSGKIRVEEVKPKSFSSHPRVLAKKKFADTFYAASGTTYEIITEDVIGEDTIRNFNPEGVSSIATTDLLSWRKKRDRERQTRWAAEKRKRCPITKDQRRKEADAKNKRYHLFMKTATPEQLAIHRAKNAAASRRRNAKSE